MQPTITRRIKNVERVQLNRRPAAIGNPRHHEDYPYDPDNPFRTETQRLKSMGIDPAEHERVGMIHDTAVLKGILIAVTVIVVLFLS